MSETRIYVDSNVYIDYFEIRSDRLVPWDEFAHQLFRRTFGCEFKIIISSFVLKELKRNGFKNHIEELKDDLEKRGKLIYLEIQSRDKREARSLKLGSHYDDRLHYVLAKKANAKFIVTRNWKDFYDLKDIPALPAEWV